MICASSPSSLVLFVSTSSAIFPFLPSPTLLLEANLPLGVDLPHVWNQIDLITCGARQSRNLGQILPIVPDDSVLDMILLSSASSSFWSCLYVSCFIWRRRSSGNDGKSNLAASTRTFASKALALIGENIHGSSYLANSKVCRHHVGSFHCQLRTASGANAVASLLASVTFVSKFHSAIVTLFMSLEYSSSYSFWKTRVNCQLNEYRIYHWHGSRLW